MPRRSFRRKTARPARRSRFLKRRTTRRTSKLSSRMRLSTSNVIAKTIPASGFGYYSNQGSITARAALTSITASTGTTGSNCWCFNFMMGDVINSGVFACFEKFRLKSYTLKIQPTTTNLSVYQTTAGGPLQNNTITSASVQPWYYMVTREVTTCGNVLTAANGYNTLRDFKAVKSFSPLKTKAIKARLSPPGVVSEFPMTGFSTTYMPVIGKGTPWIMSASYDPEQYGILIAAPNVPNSGQYYAPSMDVFAVVEIVCSNVIL